MGLFDDCGTPAELHEASRRIEREGVPPTHRTVIENPAGGILFEFDNARRPDSDELYMQARECIVRLREKDPSLTGLSTTPNDPDDGMIVVKEWCQEARTLPPLGKGAAMIYEKLKSLEPYQAMTLPEIQNWYYDATNGKDLDEGTWKRWRPELESYGMKNRPNVGYYLEK